MPVEDASVDVVISNCVINLSGDKHQVLREAARVLVPGGRFAVSDVIADTDMDEETRRGHGSSGQVASPARSPKPSTRPRSRAAGLVDVKVSETHRVHTHAASAMVRARRP